MSPSGACDNARLRSHCRMRVPMWPIDGVEASPQRCTTTRVNGPMSVVRKCGSSNSDLGNATV